MTPGEPPREGSKAAREFLANAPREPTRSVRGAARRAASWLDVRPLWQSRNDRVARVLADPTDALRARWIEWLDAAGRGGDPEIADHAGRERVSFAVLGDPGEGDRSQEVVVPALLSVQDECDFLVVCSDVVYPAGDVNQYEQKFYEPYADWRKPIYALPGNHDWYDELEGFMFHFCGVDPPPRGFGDDPPRPLLWRRPRRRREPALALRDGRPEGRGGFQPGPYFLIDAGPIAVVCIDTGIQGNLDGEQGRWLARVSREVPKPKVLLTGKPLIVDGDYHPGAINSFDRTVDDIVRDPRNGYVAAIGGDIHNYQRYPIEQDGRRIEYVVSGGGGAFMHATHRIRKVDLGGVAEDDFRCFPLRGDSLRLYARVVVRALTRLVVESAAALLLSVALVALVTAGLIREGADVSTWILLELLAAGPLAASLLLWRQVTASGALAVIGLRGTELTPEQASQWMSDEINSRPALEGDQPTEQGAALARFVAPRLHHTSGFLSSFFSEIFDIDEPPMYKQFLRIDADRDTLRITCHAAIGVDPEPERPYVEESVEVPLRRGPGN